MSDDTIAMQLDMIIREGDPDSRVLVFIYYDENREYSGGDILKGCILVFKLEGSMEPYQSYHYIIGVDTQPLGSFRRFRITYRVAESQTESEQGRMVSLGEITLNRYNTLLSHLWSRPVHTTSRQGWLREVFNYMIRLHCFSMDELNLAIRQIPTSVNGSYSY